LDMKKLSFPVKFEWLADYQLKNFKTAFAALHLLDSLLPEFSFDPKKVKTQIPKLLAHWKYMGRMQVLQKKPMVILDSAHNQAGINEWRKMIENQQYEKLHIVFGTVKDKDPTKVLNALPQSAKFYFVKAKIPRAHDAASLKEKAATLGLEGKSYKSVAQGLKAARLSASSKDLIAVCGSIFVIAELV